MTPRIRAIFFALALALAGCNVPATQAQLVDARGAPTSFAPLVKRVVPAVVNISVIEGGQQEAVNIPPELRGTPFERMLRNQQRRPVLGAGSGFVIDPAGIIVTNAHVAAHANRITVALSDGTELPARVLGADELTDIAVIRVNPPRPLPSVTWGDSKNTEIGDWILAAGNPFGVGISVTAGIVSARGRDIGAGPFDDFLQLDAPINPGNSGGPTFNMSGQVIGVNTAIVSPTGGSVGIGFAVPSEIAGPIVSNLIARGHVDRGWLGVSVQEVHGISTGSGVTIATVERSGPAARAGLRPGDIVLSVNGAKVDTAQALIRAIASITPGNGAQLTVRRAGQTVDIPVTVGLRPAEQQG